MFISAGDVDIAVSIVQRTVFEGVRELNRRVEEQERRLAELERHFRALGLRGPPCPRCENGGMVREDDRLQCSDCGYAHAL